MFSIKHSVYFQKKLSSNNKKLPNRAFNINNKIIKILYNKFAVKDSIYVTIYINIVKVYIILGQKFKIEIVYEKYSLIIIHD